MSVRAKFYVTKVESSIYNRYVPNPEDRSKGTYEKVEMRTIVMHPVSSSEAGSENKMFWDASPSGELRLGTVNPAAWRAFELDRAYYVDFTEAND